MNNPVLFHSPFHTPGTSRSFYVWHYCIHSVWQIIRPKVDAASFYNVHNTEVARHMRMFNDYLLLPF